jgi:hypothetical protein
MRVCATTYLITENKSSRIKRIKRIQVGPTFNELRKVSLSLSLSLNVRLRLRLSLGLRLSPIC